MDYLSSNALFYSGSDNWQFSPKISSMISAVCGMTLELCFIFAQIFVGILVKSDDFSNPCWIVCK